MENSFYPKSLLSVYADAGSLPSDTIEVSDKIFDEFTQNRPGKIRISGDDGYPAWKDAPPLSSDQLSLTARQYRDAFIRATDPMMVSDYSIGDVPLTEDQRRELIATRAMYRTWPTLAGWPLIVLPAIGKFDKSHWLLVEAVNNGYVVPEWPPEIVKPE